MELDSDSDLGELPVTVAVGTLAPAQVADALTAGAARAEGMLAADLLHGAALGLQGEVRVVGRPWPAALCSLRPAVCRLLRPVGWFDTGNGGP